MMQKKILVVDDVELNREMLLDILEEDYAVIMAENGEQAIEKMADCQDGIAAVLLDLQMPVMDGFEVLEEMKERDWMKKMPVLIISGETAVDIENQCFELGVADFIHKPFEPLLIKNRIRNMVDLFAYKNELEEKVANQTQTLRRQNKRLKEQAVKLKENNEKIIEILGTVVEYRNLESGQHIQRVKGFTRILATRMMVKYPECGLDENKIDVLVNASSLHDVGKIVIPDKILLKPGKLTAEEFEYMKTHTTRGCEIIETVGGIWEEDYRKASYEICRHHHERYDGRGYPDGLRGEDIPISAQIVSVADVYDALVSERVYKSACPKEKAFYMILNGECGVFSPKLMECFQEVREAFETLADQMRG